MRTLSIAPRSSYNQPNPNIRVGKRTPPRLPLSNVERDKLATVTIHLNAARKAETAAEADYQLSCAYRIIGKVMNERIVTRAKGN